MVISPAPGGSSDEHTNILYLLRGRLDARQTLAFFLFLLVQLFTKGLRWCLVVMINGRITPQGISLLLLKKMTRQFLDHERAIDLSYERNVRSGFVLVSDFVFLDCT